MTIIISIALVSNKKLYHNIVQFVRPADDKHYEFINMVVQFALLQCESLEPGDHIINTSFITHQQSDMLLCNKIETKFNQLIGI